MTESMSGGAWVWGWKVPPAKGSGDLWGAMETPYVPTVVRSMHRVQLFELLLWTLKVRVFHNI